MLKLGFNNDPVLPYNPKGNDTAGGNAMSSYNQSKL